MPAVMSGRTIIIRMRKDAYRLNKWASGNHLSGGTIYASGSPKQRAIAKKLLDAILVVEPEFNPPAAEPVQEPELSRETALSQSTEDTSLIADINARINSAANSDE